MSFARYKFVTCTYTKRRPTLSDVYIVETNLYQRKRNDINLTIYEHINVIHIQIRPIR